MGARDNAALPGLSSADFRIGVRFIFIFSFLLAFFSFRQPTFISFLISLVRYHDFVISQWYIWMYFITALNL